MTDYEERLLKAIERIAAAVDRAFPQQVEAIETPPVFARDPILNMAGRSAPLDVGASLGGQPTNSDVAKNL